MHINLLRIDLRSELYAYGAARTYRHVIVTFVIGLNGHRKLKSKGPLKMFIDKFPFIYCSKKKGILVL